MTMSRRLPPHAMRDRFDPIPEFAAHCARSPLATMDISTGPSRREAWIATGYEEVRAVLGDATRFTTRPPADTREASRQLVDPGNLLQYHPPEHTRLRRMLVPEFTVRRLRRLEPRIGDIVEEALDDLEAAGPPADLVRHFAQPVPALITCELLGIPPDDLIELGRWMEITEDPSRGGQQRQEAGAQLHRYLRGLVEQQRSDPGEELLGMLVREHGDDLSDAELAGLAVFLLGPGFENTAGALAMGALTLLEHPGQLAVLRDKPEMLDHAVEEMFRYVNVIPAASPRTALEDVELAGQTIRAGEKVVCSLLAANRDEAVTPAPGEFDLHRASVDHLAFGHGIHHCPAAPLARLVMKGAFAGLLRRFPTLRPAIPPEEVLFRKGTVYGIYKLPVVW